MKKYSFLLAAAFAAVFASCTKTHYDAVVPDAPTGTFAGQFRLVHRKATGSALDTPKKANIQVQLVSSGYTFKILGDTTVHAGSSGTYAYDGNFIQFNDITSPTVLVSTTAKPHLAGVYQYLYNSNTFQAVRTYSDTLSYQYDLKRTL